MMVGNGTLCVVVLTLCVVVLTICSNGGCGNNGIMCCGVDQWWLW